MAERIERDLEQWTERIRSGDSQAIARAITAVENRSPLSQHLLKSLFPHTGHAVILGITGPSGAGKSSLVDRLTGELRKRGKTVGILAIDPTSPFSGGAILGDRIRMQTHTGDPGAYIRSMATRGSLGGLTRSTVDAALILDAAGKDYILIETVGVGQDEVEIAKLADVTLVLLVPGLGDDVQAFKAGVMEIADVFVINKADLPGADRVEQELRAALALADSAEQPPILRTVATRGEGIPALLDSISALLETRNRPDAERRARVQVWRTRLLELLRDRVLEAAQQQFANMLDKHAEAVAARKEDPYTILEQALNSLNLSSCSSKAETAVLDHLGIAVDSLAGAVAFYEQALGIRVSGYETIPAEKTNVAMLPVGQSRIELLEPTEPDSPIGRFLAKRGAGLHHICLRVPDLAETIAKLRQSGVELVSDEPGIGAGGHRYVFVHPRSTGGVLLELVQA